MGEGSIAVALLCIVIAGVLWAVTPPRTAVVLDISTSAIELALTKPWEWNGAVHSRGAPVRLEQLSDVQSPALGRCRAADTSTCTLTVTADLATLSALRLQAGTRLTLERFDPSTVVMFTRGKSALGTLSVAGASRSALQGSTDGPADARRQVFDIPEPVEFRTTAAEAVPSRLELPSRDTLLLRNLSIGALSFAQETASGETRKFESTILGGRIVLPAAADTILLRPGDAISLAGLRGRIVALEVGPTIELRFEGHVKRIALGPEGFSQDVTPRLLETSYHSKSLAFFWGAATFLWGLLWSAKRVLLGK
jgi:hypothetical protein